jgi:hypothetical protein
MRIDSPFYGWLRDPAGSLCYSLDGEPRGE